MRRRALVLGLLLAAGCSLPLPSGVHTPTGITGQNQAAGLQVLPQGPTPGMSQKGAVEGFLAAQASPLGDYAVARRFLTGEAARTWSPDTGVRVFRPESEDVAVPNPREPSVRVHLVPLGNVDTTGHFVPETTPVNDYYGLTKVAAGWRISSVPSGVGLQLSLVDLRRTFTATNVYYLAPRLPGQGTARHLVPDRVFLPDGSGADAAAALVRRALRPPSDALTGSVDPNLPGISAVSVTGTRDGTVTVTLSEEANGLGADDLRDLSARLVWTLRADRLFTGLTIRTARGILRPPGSSEVQPATSWQAYDPEGLGDDPAYYFVARKRLRASGTTLKPSPFTQVSPGVDVRDVAVSPRGDRIATLHPRGSQVEIDLGTAADARVTTGPSRPGLSSPTWGSGEGGLWMLQRETRVLRLDSRGVLREVTVRGRPTGAVTSMALSRDGARVAMVIGKRAYVGKVVWRGSTPTIEGLALLLAGAGAPTQVAWSTATEIVVLQPDQPRSLVRVAVDSSVTVPVLTGSLQPERIAAAGPLLVVESGDALYSVAQSITQVQKSGTRPAFPG